MNVLACHLGCLLQGGFVHVSIAVTAGLTPRASHSFLFTGRVAIEEALAKPSIWVSYSSFSSEDVQFAIALLLSICYFFCV